MDSILEPSRQHQQQQQQQQQHADAESSLSLIHDRDDAHQLQHQLQHPPAGGVLSSCSSILTESNLLRWSRIHSMNGIVPPPRSGAASVVACGKLFVFGGYGGGTGRLDDFWSFSFDTQTWEKVQVQSRRQPGCRENNGVVISGTFDDYYYNNDDNNADADANDDADGKNSIKNTSSRAAKIFLFGGYNGSAWLNDLWEFNIETSCWTCIQESSDPVAAVGAAAAAAPLPPSLGDQDVSAVERRMNNISINDGSHFNNNNNSNNSNNVSIVPSRRFGYVSVVHKGKLILWGGFDGSRWLNDMYVFDFAKKEWTEIPQVNNSNNNTATSTANGNSSSSSSQANNASMAIPSVRSCPAWAKDDNYVYIQGGYDGVERKSDFWACDLNTYTWTQMPSSRGTPPSPRYFHSCCLLRSNSDSGGGGRDNDGGSAGVSCLDSSNKNKLYLYGVSVLIAFRFRKCYL
jgi:leucine-zipper-like transcriptional regulator 1